MNLNAPTQKLLGRYQHTHAGSYKYWQVKFIKDDDFEVSWGRIGHAPQGSNRVNTKELNKKAREKTTKGYVKVAWQEIDNYHEKLMLETELTALAAQNPENNKPMIEKKKFKI